MDRSAGRHPASNWALFLKMLPCQLQRQRHECVTLLWCSQEIFVCLRLTHKDEAIEGSNNERKGRKEGEVTRKTHREKELVTKHRRRRVIL